MIDDPIKIKYQSIGVDIWIVYICCLVKWIYQIIPWYVYICVCIRYLTSVHSVFLIKSSYYVYIYTYIEYTLDHILVI